MTSPQTQAAGIGQHLLYQYCPKIAVVRDDKVLLARRAGEQDLDGAYTLVGGKIEHGDPTITTGIARELREEIGPDVEVNLLATYSVAAEFTKADGSRMILPHFLAEHLAGEVDLNNDEYSTYLWASIDDLGSLSGVLPNIPAICAHLLRLREIAEPSDYVTLGPTDL